MQQEPFLPSSFLRHIPHNLLQSNIFRFHISYFLLNRWSKIGFSTPLSTIIFSLVCHEKLNKKTLQNLKKNSLSIAFYNKNIDENISLYLKEIGFVLTYNFEETKFKSNSPLLISKHKPNFLSIQIYR